MPWILRNATSAMLFNHGSWFQGQGDGPFGATQLTAPSIPGIRNHEELAGTALKALRATPGGPPAGDAITDQAFLDLRWVVVIAMSLVTAWLVGSAMVRFLVTGG